jgi:hypothetical protein
VGPAALFFEGEEADIEMNRKIIVLGICGAVGLALVLLLRPSAPVPVPDAAPMSAEKRPGELPAQRTSEPSRSFGEMAPRETPEANEIPSLPIPEEERFAIHDGSIDIAPSVGVKPQLVPRTMSQVPHKVLHAWDEVPDSPNAGSIRAFMLVVDPNISTASLEQLVDDVREAQAGAEVLDIRVFDSEEAVVYKHTTGGSRAGYHLLADVKQNPRLGVDTVRIRGVLVPQ